MLAEGAAQLDAEQASTGHPSVWREVYNLMRNMDLELIRRNPNPELLTDKGVKRGTAERVVSDIDYWVETIKRPETEE
jgi:hypothetical protein